MREIKPIRWTQPQYYWAKVLLSAQPCHLLKTDVMAALMVELGAQILMALLDTLQPLFAQVPRAFFLKLLCRVRIGLSLEDEHKQAQREVQIANWYSWWLHLLWLCIEDFWWKGTSRPLLFSKESQYSNQLWQFMGASFNDSRIFWNMILLLLFRVYISTMAWEEVFLFRCLWCQEDLSHNTSYDVEKSF